MCIGRQQHDAVPHRAACWLQAAVRRSRTGKRRHLERLRADGKAVLDPEDGKLWLSLESKKLSLLEFDFARTWEQELRHIEAAVKHIQRAWRTRQAAQAAAVKAGALSCVSNTATLCAAPTSNQDLCCSSTYELCHWPSEQSLVSLSSGQSSSCYVESSHSMAPELRSACSSVVLPARDALKREELPPLRQQNHLPASIVLQHSCGDALASLAAQAAAARAAVGGSASPTPRVAAMSSNMN